MFLNLGNISAFKFSSMPNKTELLKESELLRCSSWSMMVCSKNVVKYSVFQ